MPYISSFAPTSAANDTTVVIKGIRLTSVTAVKFGSSNAKSFVVVNDSTINAVVGAGASGLVKVTKGAGSDSLAGFLYCTGVVMTTDFTYNTNFADVTFTNNTVNATTYLWQYGDGTTGTQASPIHHYSNFGSFTACLISNNACTKEYDTVCKVIPTVGYVFDDGDRDGLYDPTEPGSYGTSTSLFDTNNDGLGDGINVFTGFGPLSADTDGDGISNAQELVKGTSPILADTDFDGVADNLDANPLDRYRSKVPPANGADVTPPVITLSEPF